MLAEFQNHLELKFPFLKDKKLLLAVSGGVDSMVLLDLFRTSEYDISVAHCNFNLRAEASDLDEELVRDYCIENNIEFYLNSFNTEEYAVLNKQSIQIAARELRYNWFDELIETKGFDFLLTAHHLDDSVETFLINFTRGTGIDGLIGIPEMNQKVIRPLLHFSRETILKYALGNGILWREDASNATTKYLRNKIRHDVVPIFKDKNPDFLKSFQQTINHLADAKALMDDASDFVKNQVSIKSDYILEIDVLKLKSFKNYKAYLYQWLKDYGFTAWDDIFNLVEASSGKQILSEDYILLKNRNSLILDVKIVFEVQEYSIFKDDKSIVSPILLTFESLENNLEQVFSANEISVDASKLIYPLKLRKWQEGDFFVPFGMNGKKKVSKFFKDIKLSLFEKDKVWILENGNNEIIWIVSYRMDDRYKITQQTINTIKIKFIQ